MARTPGSPLRNLAPLRPLIKKPWWKCSDKENLRAPEDDGDIGEIGVSAILGDPAGKQLASDVSSIHQEEIRMFRCSPGGVGRLEMRTAHFAP